MVPLSLLALAALSVGALPFVTHARNRLLSGQPIRIGAIPLEWPALAALAAALGLVLLPQWRAGALPRWLGLVGVGLAIAALSSLAAGAAAQLAAGALPSARTSLGAGFWCAAAALLLLAADLARSLRFGAAAILPVVAPLVLLLAVGNLAPLSLLREYAVQRNVFGAALLRHLVLVAAALGPAIAIGVPLGIMGQRRAGLRRAMFPVLNGIQTVPSIALFGLLIGPLSLLGRFIPGVAGVGLVPAVIALVLYSLLPIVRNTVEGLDAVPRAVRVAAAATGMNRAQTFWQVEAPLGLPVLLAGLRVTAVQAVGLAAVSALIGAGGLGAIIFQGLFANALDLVLLGALPVIALAVVTDLLFGWLADAARTRLGGAA